LRELPRDFINRSGELRALLGLCGNMDPHSNSVILGLIALNFVLLALAALGGLFEVDTVFVLLLLLLTASAALLSDIKLWRD
jgi:hypothetical protein